MEVGDALGNQVGAAYVNKEGMRELKVMSRVFFCWPQLEPARARRLLMRGVDRVMMDEI